MLELFGQSDDQNIYVCAGTELLYFAVSFVSLAMHNLESTFAKYFRLKLKW